MPSSSCASSARAWWVVALCAALHTKGRRLTHWTPCHPSVSRGCHSYAAPKQPLFPLPSAIHRHNCTLWLRSGQDRRACTRSHQLYAEGGSVGDGGQPRRKCGVCGVAPDVHILHRRRERPQPSQAGDGLGSASEAGGGASGYPHYPPFPPRTVVAYVLVEP